MNLDTVSTALLRSETLTTSFVTSSKDSRGRERQRFQSRDIRVRGSRKESVNEPVRRGFGPSVGEDLDLSDVQAVALPRIPDLGGRSVRGRWNPVHMAFLGDAVWELFMRNHYFSPPTKLQTYYDSVQNKVRAESQALFYEVLLAGPLLSNREKEILKWGHNAKVVAPKRFSASGKHVDTYKRATALECLVGYLYLTNLPRLQELVQYLLQIQ